MEVVQKDFTGEGNGDEFGHGTMMASIVAGRNLAGKRYGMAPGISRLVMVKFIEGRGGARMETLPIVLDWTLSFDGGAVDIVCLAFGARTVETLGPVNNHANQT
jgi:hypothetical protein